MTEGIYNQAVVSYDPTSTAYTIGLEGRVDGAGTTAFTSTSLTAFSLYSTQVELTSITGGGSSDAIVNAPTDVTLPVTYADPIDAPQPNKADPVQATVIPGNSVFITFDRATNYPGEALRPALDNGLADNGIDGRLSNAVEINGDIWVAQTVLDGTNSSSLNPTGTDAIAWDEISLATDTVIQHGLISSKGSGDPNLFFYSPSIAVNSTGEVVIGFSGSDQATFISSYAAVGTTNFGVTTFAMKLDPTTNVPVPLQAGKGVYTGEGLNAVPGELGPMPGTAPGSALAARR